MSYQIKTVDIIISEELKSILHNIRNQSVVANKLLKRRILKEELVENPINYIAISSSDNTKISYLTKERIDNLSIEEYWTSSRRFQIKPGAFVSKVFKDIAPKDVEQFANLFKSETTKFSFEWKVVNGDDIKKYYLWDSYASDRGTLGSSCMKHESCQKFLNIYSKNTDQVSMLTMLDKEGLLMGRAILWDINGIKVMDRIYTINQEEFEQQFKKWATENGYLYKSEQNWANSLYFENIKTQKKEMNLKIELKHKNFSYYPYMDTFKFLDENGNIYNYQPKDTYFKTLASADGGKYDQDYFKLDDIERVFRHRSELVCVEYANINTSEHNTRYSRSNDCYILRDDAIYNQNAEDYIFVQEKNHLNNWTEINRRIERLGNKIENTANYNEIQLNHFSMANQLISSLRSSLNTELVTQLINQEIENA